MIQVKELEYYEVIVDDMVKHVITSFEILSMIKQYKHAIYGKVSKADMLDYIDGKYGIASRSKRENQFTGRVSEAYILDKLQP